MTGKKKKTFVTFFPSLENVHLRKDVGMLPFIMFRDYGYDATVVAFQHDTAYPALESEVRGLRLKFLGSGKKYNSGKLSFRVLSYLWKQAKDIDVLNLYHKTIETLIYGLIYKMRNRRGVAYVKLDMNTNRQRSRTAFHKKIFDGLFFSLFPGCISCESESAFYYLLSVFPSLRTKLFVIPNGIDDVKIRNEKVNVRPFAEKENLIITVGRIGAPEKNNELLLRVASEIDLKDWKVAFIGPVEASFAESFSAIIREKPYLSDKILLVGSITDHKTLYSWYNRSKVYCLTSLWEAFPLVVPEALYFGNYIITTEIAAAKDITHDGKTGCIINSQEELAVRLQAVIDETFLISDCYDSILEYSKKFRWKDNLEALEDRVNAAEVNK